MKLNTKEITLSALFSAVIAIFSLIAIPTAFVPVTLGVFGVLFTCVVLGRKLALLSVIVYILTGAIGIPVFSGFKGGMNVLLSPTGGYILSYIFMPFITGFLSDKTRNLNNKKAFFVRLLSCFASIFTCYLMGTLMFMIITHQPLISALSVSVFPFVIFDIIKCVLACVSGNKVQRFINRL